MEHELLVAMVQEHPHLLLALLRATFGVQYGEDVEVLASSEVIRELVPTERRADAVLVVRDHGDERPQWGLVVEVQLRPDPSKRLTWPVYVANVRQALDCPMSLVVIALDDVTAAWCRQPIALDDLGSVLLPWVVGPSQVPPVDPETTRRHPELALLSLLAHRNEPIALGIARSLLEVCVDLDEATSGLYADIVFGFVNEAAKRALEAEMRIENYEFQSDFMREMKAKLEAGREQGREQGLEQGLEQGRAEALAKAILLVLGTRGLAVDEAQHARILACNDVDTLQAWLQAAVTTDDVATMLVD